MKQSRVLNVLSALANEHRLEAVRLMVPKGPEGMTAGEIGAALDLSASRLSFHLNALEAAGLIESERKGRNICYRVNYATLRDLMGYLLTDCCGAHPEICSSLMACDGGPPGAPRG